MRGRPRLGAALLLLAALGLLAEGGVVAFDAATSATRSSSAQVVGMNGAYDGVVTVRIAADNLLGYSGKDGVRVGNNGTVPTTFTWTTTSDPSLVLGGVTQCSANTAVGSACVIKFSGPAKAIGTYTFTGRVEGAGSSFRSSIPNVQVTVQYCLLGIC